MRGEKTLKAAFWPVALPVLLAAFSLVLAGSGMLPIPSASAEDNDPGAGPYKTKCIACHGQDGSGNTPVGKSVKSADLRSPEVQNKSDAELAEFIATGRGNMPSFKSSTSDEELRALVAHVRTFAAKKPKKAESQAQ